MAVIGSLFSSMHPLGGCYRPFPAGNIQKALMALRTFPGRGGLSLKIVTPVAKQDIGTFSKALENVFHPWERFARNLLVRGSWEASFFFLRAHGL